MAGCKPGDDNSRDRGGHQDQGRSHEDKRGPTLARVEPGCRNHHHKEIQRDLQDFPSEGFKIGQARFARLRKYGGPSRI